MEGNKPPQSQGSKKKKKKSLRMAKEVKGEGSGRDGGKYRIGEIRGGVWDENELFINRFAIVCVDVGDGGLGAHVCVSVCVCTMYL